MTPSLLQKIRAMTHLSDIESLRHKAMVQRDYLEELKRGEKQVTQEFLNSSSLFLEEDVVGEVDDLAARLDRIERELKQLDLVDDALNSREKELKNKQ